MKNLLPLIFLLGFTQTYCQWIKSPEVLSNNLFDIEAANANELIVVGTGLNNDLSTGIIYKSLDGGISWDTVYYHELVTGLGRIHKVNIVNDDIAYAANSGSRVYKSIDGGANWNTLNLPTEETGPATDALFFIDTETGFVGNYFGEIFKTSDGGSNWDLVYFAQPYQPIYDISCPTNNTCFARTSGPPKLLKSVDAGDTWSGVPDVPSTFALGGMHAINEDTIVIVTSDALIHRSIDGGESWDSIPSPINIGFNDVDFVDNIGFAVGREEAIIKTIDYGETWTLGHHIPGSLEWISAIHMVDSTTAFACSHDGSFYSLGNANSTNELALEPNLTIYPNPFLNHITIEFDQAKTGIIEITSSHGQLIHSVKLNAQSSIKVELNSLNATIFFVTFKEQDSNLKVTRRVVRME